MFNGKPYHTRTKEEEEARKKTAKPKAKSKSRKLRRPGRGTTAFGKRAYGGGVKNKTVKRQAGGSMSGKPKGVGCATRGYGKAMK